MSDEKSFNSPVIAKIAFSGGNLIVYFNSGASYSYSGVSRDIYDKFAKSYKPGKFFADVIRGKFAHTRLEAKEARRLYEESVITHEFPTNLDCDVIISKNDRYMIKF